MSIEDDDRLVTALDLLCDCAEQFLIDSDDGTITHSFMSTEERLCAFLVENGRMEQLGVAKFRMLPNAEVHRAVPAPVQPLVGQGEL